jgi:hypothetical protein
MLKLAAVWALLSAPSASIAQEVSRDISSERLEGILRAANIEFNKGALDDSGVSFDCKTNDVTFQLTNFKGRELKLSGIFQSTDWKTVNDWNGKSKYTRARLLRDAKDGKEFSALESYLDLAGGVTEDSVKNFLMGFANEAAIWSKLAVPLVSEEETFKNFTPDRIEKILSDLKIQFKKTPHAKEPGIFAFDYLIKELPIRLTTFGGAELMLDCVYPQTSLAKINEWNVKRNFVRAVLYPNNGKNMPYSQLEANLDCAPGVSESIVRYFITAFGREAVDFESYLKGAK